jgi:hypothetical protein
MPEWGHKDIGPHLLYFMVLQIESLMESKTGNEKEKIASYHIPGRDSLSHQQVLGCLNSSII